MKRRACCDGKVHIQETLVRRNGNIEVLKYLFSLEGREKRELEMSVDIKAQENEGTEFIQGKIWPAALVLCSFIYLNPSLVKNNRVLELGCGTGICSLFASKFQAKEIIATDLSLPKHTPQDNSHVKFATLKWGLFDETFEDTLHLVGTDLDLVIGSDLLYETTDEGFDPNPLLATLSFFKSWLLQRKKVIEIILVHVNRNQLQHGIFLSSLQDFGFVVVETFSHERLLDFESSHRSLSFFGVELVVIK